MIMRKSSTVLEDNFILNSSGFICCETLALHFGKAAKKVLSE